MNQDVSFFSNGGTAVTGEAEGANKESRRSNGVWDIFSGRLDGENKSVHRFSAMNLVCSRQVDHTLQHLGLMDTSVQSHRWLCP